MSKGCGTSGRARTRCGHKLEVMRHRGVVDQSVCNHLVGFVGLEYEME